MSPSISVIIPSYNGLDLLLENLPYTIKSLETLDKSEIIIIDDGSTDDTFTLLNETYPEIRILRNSENLGFIPSVNKGLKNSTSDLVFLLNNDIKPDKDYITSSLKYFDQEDTFGVMGIIKDEVSKYVLEGIKYPEISLSGLKYKDIRDKEIEGLSGNILTFYLCGGNAIIDRRKIIELKGLSEIYEPFYLEDVDLSIRAWLAGWKSYFNPEAVCYHKHSATIRKYYQPDYIENIAKRNRLFINYIYLKGRQLQIFVFSTRIKIVFYWLKHKLKLKSVYHGFRDFFRYRSELREFRPLIDKKFLLDKVIKVIRKNINSKLGKHK